MASTDTMPKINPAFTNWIALGPAKPAPGNGSKDVTSFATRNGHWSTTGETLKQQQGFAAPSQQLSSSQQRRQRRNRAQLGGEGAVPGPTVNGQTQLPAGAAAPLHHNSGQPPAAFHLNTYGKRAAQDAFVHSSHSGGDQLHMNGSSLLNGATDMSLLHQVPYVYLVCHRCLNFSWFEYYIEVTPEGATLPDRPSFLVGDFVICEGDRGVHIGQVIGIEPFNAVEPHCSFATMMTILQQPPNRPRPGFPHCLIFRPATREERAYYQSQMREEAEACLYVANQAISEVRELADNGMRIIDVEIQFDRHKITLFYFSDRFVSVKPLVSALYKTYGCRITVWDVSKTLMTIVQSRNTSFSLLRRVRDQFASASLHISPIPDEVAESLSQRNGGAKCVTLGGNNPEDATLAFTPLAPLHMTPSHALAQQPFGTIAGFVPHRQVRPHNGSGNGNNNNNNGNGAGNCNGLGNFGAMRPWPTMSNGHVNNGATGFDIAAAAAAAAAAANGASPTNGSSSMNGAASEWNVSGGVGFNGSTNIFGDNAAAAGLAMAATEAAHTWCP